MMLHRVIVVVLALVLFASLLGANTALALDRGALDAEYMKGSAQEANLYPALEGAVSEQIETSMPESGDELPVDLDLQSVASAAITDEYIESQSEANIDRLYAYVHGEEPLRLVIDLRPVKENAIDALADQVAEMDITDLGLEVAALDQLANLTESESSYEAERARFRELLKAEIKNDAGVHPEDDFGNERLANLAGSASSYAAERTAFRDELKAEIKDEYGLHPEDDFGSDRLANLAASESSYASEREAFKEARKQETQDATPYEMSDEELEEAYEDNLDDIRAELREELETEFLSAETPDSLVGPVSDLIDVTVDGLTADLSYDAFAAKYAGAKTDIDTGLDAAIDANMGEIRPELRLEIEAGIDVPDEAPDEIETVVDDLVDLTVDAYTTSMSYDAFVSDYETIKVDFDAALDAAIDENMDEVRAELRGELLSQLENGGVPAAIEGSLTDAVDVVVDGLTTDMTYTEFTTELNAIKRSMAVDAAEYALNEHEGGVPDEFELTDEFDGADEEELAIVQQAVSTIGLLAWLLPLVGLVTIGGLYLVAGSTQALAIAVGSTSVLAGVISAAVARIVPSAISDLIGGDLSPQLVEALQSMVWALFAPMWGQSIVLSGLGVVVGGVGIAMWAGVGPFRPTEE